MLIVCEYIGYFARWAAIRKLLYQFLDVEKKSDEDPPIKKQILSLGAGFDTTYFQLQVLGFPCEFLYVLHKLYLRANLLLPIKI